MSPFEEDKQEHDIPPKQSRLFPLHFTAGFSFPSSALNWHSVLYERLLVQSVLEEYAKQLRSVTLLMCFQGSYSFYEWFELHIRNVEIHTLDKMPSEKSHRSYLELQGDIPGVQKRTERKEGIKECGKVNNWMEFARTLCCLKLEYRFHHSLFATHCCHHVLPHFFFSWNHNVPWNRSMCTAVGEKDLKIGKRVPKRKHEKWASLPLEDWALLEGV